ncbi:pilus assembly protein PilZ [Thiocystis violacea]|nr:PilZ domain-containing protein [Thiocystis violacea]MBK1717767.1 pilus assembly protein PilZ [Thiocystis violacea]
MNLVSDRRLHPRLPFEVEVELYRPDCPTCVVRTEDLSNGGVLLLLEATDRPAIGTQVRVRVSIPLGGDDGAPLVDATVVRHTDDGVAIRFDETPAS